MQCKNKAAEYCHKSKEQIKTKLRNKVISPMKQDSLKRKVMQVVQVRAITKCSVM